MANLNKVILIGRLTRDPELRRTPSGQAVAEFGLAVNRTWTGKDGNRQEDTAFIEITTWARTAELAQQYLSKGRQVFIEGYLKYDQWTSPEGQKRHKLTVTAENLQFLDSRGNEGDGGGSGDGAGYRRSAEHEPEGGQRRGGNQRSGSSGRSQRPASDAPADDFSDEPYGGGGNDDIPF